MHSLPCEHAFCRSCISRWLRHNPTCPLCRNAAAIDDLRPPVAILYSRRRCDASDFVFTCKVFYLVFSCVIVLYFGLEWWL